MRFDGEAKNVMAQDFEKVDNKFDPDARREAERLAYEHLVDAMELRDRQSAFLNQTAETINSCSFVFGGDCGIESPPMGVAEELVVMMRYMDRTALETAFDRLCNALPMKGRGDPIIYVGFRCEWGYERPKVIDVQVDIGNGKTLPGWAADVKLRALFGLVRRGR